MSEVATQVKKTRTRKPKSKTQPESSGIPSIKHTDLSPSPLNPRKRFDEKALEDLASSIAEKGILQNLVARPKGGGYEIAAGERRYRAVTLLIKEKKLPEDYALPVKVQEMSDLELVQLATTENGDRADMHPLEDAEAYRTMLELGADTESIALKMGKSEQTVKQRLALAEKLSKEVKEAYYNGDLTLSQAQALTAASAEMQSSLLETIQSDPYGEWDAYAIRQFLDDHLIPITHAIFPLEQYRGELSNDLFSEEAETCFFDTEQAKQLQLEALEQLKAKYQETWAWVEVLTSHSFYRWNYEGHEKTDPKTQGVVITLSPHSLEVTVHEGLTKRGEDSSPTFSTSTPTTAATNSNPTPPKKPKDAYTRKQLETARKLKTVALQDELTQHFRTCLILNIMGLLGVDDVKIKGDAPALGMDFQSEKLESRFKEHEAELNATLDNHQVGGYPLKVHTYGEGYIKLYQHLKALPDERLHELFCALTAFYMGDWNNYNTDTGDRPLALEVARDLDLDMHQHFTLTEDYLKLYRKNQLHALAREVGISFNTEGLKTDVLRNLILERAKGKAYLPGLMHWFEAGQEPPEGEVKEALADAA